MQKLNKFLAVGLILTSILATGCSDVAPKEVLLEEVGSSLPPPPPPKIERGIKDDEEYTNVVDLYPNQKLVNATIVYGEGISVTSRPMRKGEVPEKYLIYQSGRSEMFLIRERKE